MGFWGCLVVNSWIFGRIIVDLGFWVVKMSFWVVKMAFSVVELVILLVELTRVVTGGFVEVIGGLAVVWVSFLAVLGFLVEGSPANKL